MGALKPIFDWDTPTSYERLSGVVQAPTLKQSFKRPLKILHKNQPNAHLTTISVSCNAESIFAYLNYYTRSDDTSAAGFEF